MSMICIVFDIIWCRTCSYLYHAELLILVEFGFTSNHLITFNLFSCIAYRQKQLIGYSVGVLLGLLLGDYGLLTFTAGNSTAVTPRPKVTMEH